MKRLLFFLLLALPCSGATLIGNLIDVFGQTYTPAQTYVKFTPGSATALGSSTVLDIPRRANITNGAFSAYLVGGYYNADFGPPHKTISILVPLNSQVTYTFNQAAQLAVNAAMFPTNTIIVSATNDMRLVTNAITALTDPKGTATNAATIATWARTIDGTASYDPNVVLVGSGAAFNSPFMGNPIDPTVSVGIATSLWLDNALVFHSDQGFIGSFTGLDTGLTNASGTHPWHPGEAASGTSLTALPRHIFGSKITGMNDPGGTTIFAADWNSGDAIVYGTNGVPAIRANQSGVTVASNLVAGGTITGNGAGITNLPVAYGDIGVANLNALATKIAITGGATVLSIGDSTGDDMLSGLSYSLRQMCGYNGLGMNAGGLSSATVSGGVGVPNSGGQVVTNWWSPWLYTVSNAGVINISRGSATPWLWSSAGSSYASSYGNRATFLWINRPSGGGLTFSVITNASTVVTSLDVDTSATDVSLAITNIDVPIGSYKVRITGKGGGDGEAQFIGACLFTTNGAGIKWWSMSAAGVEWSGWTNMPQNVVTQFLQAANPDFVTIESRHGTPLMPESVVATVVGVCTNAQVLIVGGHAGQQTVEPGYSYTIATNEWRIANKYGAAFLDAWSYMHDTNAMYQQGLISQGNVHLGFYGILLKSSLLSRKLGWPDPLTSTGLRYPLGFGPSATSQAASPDQWSGLQSGLLNTPPVLNPDGTMSMNSFRPVGIGSAYPMGRLDIRGIGINPTPWAPFDMVFGNDQTHGATPVTYSDYYGLFTFGGNTAAGTTPDAYPLLDGWNNMGIGWGGAGQTVIGANASSYITFGSDDYRGAGQKGRWLASGALVLANVTDAFSWWNASDFYTYADTGYGTLDAFKGVYVGGLHGPFQVNATGNVTANSVSAAGLVTASGYDTSTNGWAANAAIGLGTNAYCTSGAATIGISGVLNGPTTTERLGQITVVATGALVFTNPISFYTSDFATSRTITNGNLAVVCVDVYPGVATNMTIAQFHHN